MSKNVFHLGLCMAGSVSAGAYTAGVVDYLIEALENWEKAKATDPSVPQHQVVIDLMCGSSGGGITSAMTFFALHDKIEHVHLQPDGKTYTAPANNIFWQSWVELSGGDIFNQMLGDDDLDSYVSSALNAGFIDKVADNFNKYIQNLPGNGSATVPYCGPAAELFVTLFNVTGINYELHSKASTASNAGKQYISDHRDIAHFRWGSDYNNDGRMPVSLGNLNYVPVVLQAAKATGAFPVGLKARLVSREAKFIWDNPFFNKYGKFLPDNIFLGNNISNPETIYTSINGDGGIANNEPVELARDILLNMRVKHYKDISLEKPVGMMDKEEKEEKKKELTNTSILLIDPFPSASNIITAPGIDSDNLIKYAPQLIGTIQSQLLFDAKEALDAYRKTNYGLHIIAPSRENVTPPFALACGSLGGFGGFLEREFRVHDFFLGRHNCQSFLRKYFVVNPDEPDLDDRKCVSSVIDSYNENPAAATRFTFFDENNKKWVPIIPDVTLTKPLTVSIVDGVSKYDEPGKLPRYTVPVLAADFLEKYRDGVSGRYSRIASSLFNVSGFLRFAIWLGVLITKKKISNAVINYITKDFQKRGLMK